MVGLNVSYRGGQGRTLGFMKLDSDPVFSPCKLRVLDVSGVSLILDGPRCLAVCFFVLNCTIIQTKMVPDIFFRRAFGVSRVHQQHSLEPVCSPVSAVSRGCCLGCDSGRKASQSNCTNNGCMQGGAPALRRTATHRARKYLPRIPPETSPPRVLSTGTS